MGPTILQDEDFDRIPLSTTRFSELRALNQIYVDKTQLIYKIARQRSPVLNTLLTENLVQLQLFYLAFQDEAECLRIHGLCSDRNPH